ncbi:hypothetical protein [Actinospica robiniae]|uniref:hypothetical protein n=1 Tax=Actinospica robiniae TaxID=304901 RepID=UPI0005545E73|nr:hypothetical protein [Actinospica robiniae]
MTTATRTANRAPALPRTGAPTGSRFALGAVVALYGALVGAGSFATGTRTGLLIAAVPLAVGAAVGLTRTPRR